MDAMLNKAGAGLSFLTDALIDLLDEQRIENLRCMIGSDL
jgi:hypothetical protein